MSESNSNNVDNSAVNRVDVESSEPVTATNDDVQINESNTSSSVVASTTEISNVMSSVAADARPVQNDADETNNAQATVETDPADVAVEIGNQNAQEANANVHEIGEENVEGVDDENDEEDDEDEFPVDGDDQEQNFINQLANMLNARGLRRYINNVLLDRLNRNDYDHLNDDYENDIAANNEEDEEARAGEDAQEEDDNDDEAMDEEEDDDEAEVETEENYEQIRMPVEINYDTALPSSHNYLGSNFTHVTSPRLVHETNDEITIPILALPGSDDYYSNSGNNVQLLPGQIMPLYFYAPLQVQMIKKRLREADDSSIGFALSTRYLRKLLTASTSDRSRSSRDEEAESMAANNEDTTPAIRIGILAEIISARDQDEQTNQDDDEENDEDALMPGASGLILKVKGQKRFEILSAKRDLTGCCVARVRILPEHVLDVNPLLAQHNQSGMKNFEFFYDAYLKRQSSAFACSSGKAELYNMCLPHDAWLYRKYDCFYAISLIVNELRETFQQPIPFQLEPIRCINPLDFSNWLLNNFPFDNRMRLKCLQLDCVNQRLIYMYDLLAHFSSIVCVECGIQLCSKSDVFSMSKQGFMQAYLNPGGFVHETLTVYKAKNLRLMSSRPTTANSWFPGYGWQIASCNQCHAHIGWRFSTTDSSRTPEKFWGLTRKSVTYAHVESTAANNETTTTAISTTESSNNPTIRPESSVGSS